MGNKLDTSKGEELGNGGYIHMPDVLRQC
jgi:hypothetical protein